MDRWGAPKITMFGKRWTIPIDNWLDDSKSGSDFLEGLRFSPATFHNYTYEMNLEYFANDNDFELSEDDLNDLFVYVGKEECTKERLLSLIEKSGFDFEIEEYDNFYNFQTTSDFVKNIRGLSDKELFERYSNKIFIISSPQRD